MKWTPILFAGIGLLLCSCQNPKQYNNGQQLTETAEDVPFEFSCRGSQPFWLLDIYPDSIIYQRAGRKKVIYPYRTPKIKGDSTLYETQTQLYDKVSNMRISVVADSCQDGTSDKVYPFTVVIDRDGEILNGCASNMPPK